MGLARLPRVVASSSARNFITRKNGLCLKENKGHKVRIGAIKISICSPINSIFLSGAQKEREKDCKTQIEKGKLEMD